ncbi:MAG TPA: hypothetical protein VKX41_16690, partial [Alloacidobacterium sp.]|nr:hypothetical protein [Alloacidobacterium sp.]
MANISGSRDSIGICFQGNYANVTNNKVDLLLRVWARGTRRYTAPATTKNGKIKPLAAIIDGKIESHPEGVYTLRRWEKGRPRYKEVGNDLDVAETAKLRLELDLRKKASEAQAETISSASELISAQSLPPAQSSTSTEDNRRPRPQRTLTSLRDSFIEKYAHGSDDTIYAYTNVANEFVGLANKRGKSTPADLDEDDVIAFDRLLEFKGKSKTTRASRYGYIRCFLRHCGLNPSRTDDNDDTSGVVTAAQHRKLKTKPKLAVETFNEADLQKLYAVSSDCHRLIWMAFRMLGLRDEELAYTLWSNIDWVHRLWLVRFKPAG